MIFDRSGTSPRRVYSLYADSGFAMAGAVAFSFVLSLFPFCIFLGAVAGLFGGEAFAKQGIERLFEIAPAPVAEALAPEVMAVMGRSRFDLLTFGALISLFFATSAIESLRAALNVAYRQKEKRPYFLCLMESSLFVILSARRHAGADLGRGGGARDGGALQAGLAALARRRGLAGADRALRDRHRRHRPAARRLSSLAGGGTPPSRRRVARRGAQRGAVATCRPAVRLMAQRSPTIRASMPASPRS